MKKLINMIILLLVSLSISYAQTENKNELIKSSVNKLFEECKNGNYQKAAVLIAYSGKDAQRDLKESYNYKNSKEAAKVKRIAKKIKAFLDISDKFTFGNIKIQENEGVTSYTVEVLFISGSQELKTLFTFTGSGDKLLLADLN